jgi:hypothetical protein
MKQKNYSVTLPRASLLGRDFNELYMALTVSNRCLEDAQAETGKAGVFTMMIMSAPIMAVNLSINANLGRFSLRSFKKHM